MVKLLKIWFRGVPWGVVGVLVFSRLTFSRPIPFRNLTCSRPTLLLPVHVRYLTFSLPVIFATRILSQNNRYMKKVMLFLYYIYLKYLQYTFKNIYKNMLIRGQYIQYMVITDQQCIKLSKLSLTGLLY